MGIEFNWIIIVESLISSLVELYVISKILNRNIGDNSKKIIFGILIISCYQTLSYIFTTSFVRPIISLFVMALGAYVVFKESFTKTFMGTFISWILLLISEIIFMVIATVIFSYNQSTFHSEIFGNLFVNFIIFSIEIIVINIPIVTKISWKLCNIVESLEKYFLIGLIVLLCIAFTIGIYLIYYSINPVSALILNLIVISIYIIIIMILFYERFQKYRMKQNLDNLLSNLKEYEKMLDYQKVANHENKNQLLVIKGLIEKEDKKVIEYLNSIISEKKEDDEDFLYKTNIIPSGGLRGLVYYKILSMKEKQITISLHISHKVRKVNLEKMGVNVNKDLCKIVGVILDNAIQAVENLTQRNIDIEMSYDNEMFLITVSNNFEGTLDISKIDAMGYTTKDEGHGYGLTLMKQLIEKNKQISNQKYIYGKIFVQKLEIHII